MLAGQLGDRRTAVAANMREDLIRRSLWWRWPVMREASLKPGHVGPVLISI